MTWSYPIIRNGLIYVADINQGLYIIRYQGPHADELARIAFAEGNSNLFAVAAETPPQATGSVAPSSPGGVLPTAHPAATSRPVVTPLYVVAGVGAGVLIVVALIAYSLLRRRGGSVQ